MTGQEIYNRAMALLGYTDADGNTSTRQFAELHKNALLLVNQVCSELHYIETGGAPYDLLSSMGEQVTISDRTALDVAPYGVAMYAAQLAGDANNQGIYAMTYNQKRSSVHRPTARVVEVFPKGEW